MSYILEALKKSEQERNPDKVPDLTTHHQAVSVEKKSGNSWVIPVAILVVINLGAIYWFMIREAGPQQPVPAAQDTQATQAEEPRKLVEMKPEPETQAPAQAEVVQTPPTKQETSTVEESPVSTNPEPVVAQEVSQPVTQQTQQPLVIGPPKFSALPHITELSQGIQNQLPAITFSTHIYVKDGGSFDIINNRNLPQGMTVSSGLVLEKIVREGVILSFRDRYFTLNSMESWQK